MVRSTAQTWSLAILTVLLVGCTGGSVAGSAPASTVAPASAPVPSASAPAATPTPAALTPSRAPDPSLLPSTTVPATTAPTEAVALVMVGPPPVFRPKSLTVSAGDVVFFLQNDSPAQVHGTHNLVVGTIGGKRIAQSEPVASGTRAIFTVQGMPAGTYDIWCSLYEHDVLGQRGTLTVE